MPARETKGHALFPEESVTVQLSPPPCHQGWPGDASNSRQTLRLLHSNMLRIGAVLLITLQLFQAS